MAARCGNPAELGGFFFLSGVSGNPDVPPDIPPRGAAIRSIQDALTDALCPLQEKANPGRDGSKRWKILHKGVTFICDGVHPPRPAGTRVRPLLGCGSPG